MSQRRKGSITCERSSQCPRVPPETLKVVHALPPGVRVIGGADDAFLKLAAEDRYFDPAADDEHGEVGGVRNAMASPIAVFRSSCRTTRPTIPSFFCGQRRSIMFVVCSRELADIAGSDNGQKSFPRARIREGCYGRSVHQDVCGLGCRDFPDLTNPWGGLVFVRSAPGGGKTTLLRLLTPGSLRRAISYGDDQRYRATRDALQDAGVVDGQRALLWGVYLPFAIEYRTLDDLGARSLHVFRALLSARIVLAALKALLANSSSCTLKTWCA